LGLRRSLPDGLFNLKLKKLDNAESDKSEEQLVGEALNLLFQTHGLPTIAFEGKEAGT
jgi:hypothetical protein